MWNRRIDVVLHEALGEHDGVFEVWPYHGMNATVTLAPSARSPRSVPAAVRDDLPAFTFWPMCTSGRC